MKTANLFYCSLLICSTLVIQTSVMEFINVEIKARCGDPATIRQFLLKNGAEYKGLDRQTDTYFNTLNGRLKLREGNIENNLIWYERSNQAGPKDSYFRLVKTGDSAGLKEALAKAMGVKVEVKKNREIYYIGNVKFHIDEVPGLGSFVEIEAGNKGAPDMSRDQLKEQCEYYLQQFSIRPEDLLEMSYSDMLLGEV